MFWRQIHDELNIEHVSKYLVWRIYFAIIAILNWSFKEKTWMVWTAVYTRRDETTDEQILLIISLAGVTASNGSNIYWHPVMG